jgi:hypothetical protein
MSPILPPSSRASFRKITDILRAGVMEFPETGYGGNGGPGRMLEDLLGVAENNADSPDLADWEVKFHGGRSLLTLFHKEPQPRGIINKMVDYYGWDDEHGRISFRHTISGPSPRGFRVENAEDRITIRNEQHPEGPVAHWLHNTLFNAFSAKLRRLIVVDGEVLADPRRVTFKTATAYWEPDIRNLSQAIADGVFYVDFDARTNGARGTSIRNHGTKFRIKPENLEQVYTHKFEIPTS